LGIALTSDAPEIGQVEPVQWPEGPTPSDVKQPAAQSLAGTN